MNPASVTQEVNITLSHHQLQIRSRDFNEDFCQWGDINVAQGVIIHPGYITLDPLQEDTFGVYVKLGLTDQFQADVLAQRRLVVPFDVLETEKLEILSVQKSFPIELPLDKRSYALYFEIGEEREVYYRLTFVPVEEKVQARFLMNDEWGGIEGHLLAEGSQ
ncbi:MAG: competence protein ComJ [Paenibacillus sp.]|nr:competence protein ComJ [Paenibacillus sp.]